MEWMAQRERKIVRAVAKCRVQHRMVDNRDSISVRAWFTVKVV